MRLSRLTVQDAQSSNEAAEACDNSIMVRATADDLEIWSESTEARAQLPRLVRRLICAEAGTQLRSNQFRAGGGVDLPGYDGIVDSSYQFQHVPLGVSVWELGTGSSSSSKASEDYLKRTGEPEGIEPATTVFNFVTSRRWNGKKTWSDERRAEGTWADVRAFDADDLEAWLETAPSVHVWLSSLIGKPTADAVDLEDYWNRWRAATDPALTAELLLAGRAESQTKLTDWLINCGSAISLSSDSVAESVCFLASTFDSLESNVRDQWFSRTVIVEGWAAAEYFLTTNDQNCVVLRGQEARSCMDLARQPKWVFLPLDRSDENHKVDVPLPRQQSPALRWELEKLGFQDRDLDKKAATASRSLMAFRRTIAVAESFNRPHWAQPAEARALVPAVLAGAWDDQNETDQAVLEKLSGEDYRAHRNKLQNLSKSEDPPIRLTGSVWHITDRLDSWSLLSQQINRQDLEVFREVAISVLREPDPKFDLPKSDQHLAAVLGKRLSHSQGLREGIGTTLSLMGALSNEVRFADLIEPSDQARLIVRDVLADGDDKDWASIAPLLPRLAEAAPAEFLAAVEKSLESGEEAPILRGLFAESESPFPFHSSLHSWLLWSLELLAWSPEHFLPSMLILASLARLDPGGSLSNRPRRSLAGILKWWLPQTAADQEARLAAIDHILRVEPAVGWQLLLDVLPQSMDSGLQSHPPMWRDWVNEQGEITTGDGVKFSLLIGERLIARADSPARLLELVQRVRDLRAETVSCLVSRIREYHRAHTASADLLKAIRFEIKSVVAYDDDSWVLTTEQIGQLEDLLSAESSLPVAERVLWLFDSHPSVIIKNSNFDFEREAKEIDRQRVEAAEAICKEVGIAGVLEVADVAGDPASIGHALAIGKVELEPLAILEEALKADNEARNRFAKGFFAGSARKAGLTSGLQILEQIVASGVPSRGIAELFLVLRATPEIWRMLHGTNESVQERYWQDIFMIFDAQDLPESEHEYAVKQLCKYGNHYAAIDFILQYGRAAGPMVRSETILDVLVGITEGKSQVTSRRQAMDWVLGEIFKILESDHTVDPMRVAVLEWHFYPALERNGGAAGLHRAIREKPELFMEIICLAYKARRSEREELTEDQQKLASRAWTVLHDFKQLPGLPPTGEVDEDRLFTWVGKVREIAASVDRVKRVDELIGQAAARSPAGDDGHWPHEIVRELIEKSASRDLDLGFELGVQNKRGVITKSIAEGGAQERQLASHYSLQASALRTRWPRTARILGEIAEGYDREAKGEDMRAELEDDLGY